MNFDTLALWLGRVVLVSGGLALTGFLFALSLRFLFEKLAHREDFFKVFGEMHRQKKFKWQRKDDK